MTIRANILFGVPGVKFCPVEGFLLSSFNCFCKHSIFSEYPRFIDLLFSFESSKLLDNRYISASYLFNLNI